MKYYTDICSDAPVVVMLCGLPGSGKSTYRNKLLAEWKAYGDMGDIASTDDIIDRYAEQDNITYDAAFGLYYKQAEREMNDKVAKMISNSTSFIWDQTNLVPKSRRRKLLKCKGYYKIGVIIDCDKHELASRLKTRKNTGKHIPDYLMKRLSNSYVKPDNEDGFDLIYAVSV